MRPIMELTLTCDHRILYGADAAQFLARIREQLEKPLRLALKESARRGRVQERRTIRQQPVSCDRASRGRAGRSATCRAGSRAATTGSPERSPNAPPPRSLKNSTACSRRRPSESPSTMSVGAAIPRTSSAGQEN